MKSNISNRFTLAVPAVVLTIAAALFVINAPGASGAADIYNQPSWAPTFLGFWAAACAIAVAAKLFLRVRRQTREPFRLSGTRLQVYGLMIVAIGILAILLAVHLGNSSTYSWLLNDKTGHTADPTAFVSLTALAILTCAGLTSWLAGQYLQGITPAPRRSGQVDAVAELLRERSQGETASRA